MSEAREKLEKIIGKEVIKKGGEKVDTSAFYGSGKVIMLYFSASWCPPCRAFTPNLVEFYDKYHTEKNFEIVFISSDQGEEAINEYFSHMSWHMVPIERIPEAKEAASSFEVRGIPTLLVLDGETGELITKEGRAGIANPDGFPWKA